MCLYVRYNFNLDLISARSFHRIIRRSKKRDPIKFRSTDKTKKVYNENEKKSAVISNRKVISCGRKRDIVNSQESERQSKRKSRIKINIILDKR